MLKLFNSLKTLIIETKNPDYQWLFKMENWDETFHFMTIHTPIMPCRPNENEIILNVVLRWFFIYAMTNSRFFYTTFNKNILFFISRFIKNGFYRRRRNMLALTFYGQDLFIR